MRQAGILAPIFSLPGAYGAGDFGRCSYAFIDYVKSIGMKIWQLLPLNPVSFGNSPYQPLSSFAGEVLYIDLESLYEEGLLSKLPAAPETDPDRVEYDKLRAFKTEVLREAYQNFKPGPDYDEFIKKDWVYLYAVFYSLKQKNGKRPWMEWKPEDRDWIRTRGALPKEIRDEVPFQMFLQYLFFKQWHKVRAYAAEQGIRLMGDIPFYVGQDSLDVWMNQENFLLDEDGYPTSVAGVPPDYFSADGQRWGNPIYDWDYLQKTDFRFWTERLMGTAELFDMIRIDHFRAFDTYWKIPADCPTAIEGEWLEAPGYEFFDLMLPKLGGTMIVAEDLGMMRDEVYELRDHYNFPGMNVIMFTMLDEEFESKKNMFIYTGTHDNDTIEGWWEGLTEEEQETYTQALEDMGIDPEKGTKAEQFIGIVLQNIADYAVLPVWDILGLGTKARVNMPSTVNDRNWTFRMRSLDGLYEKAEWLKNLLIRTGRCPGKREFKFGVFLQHLMQAAKEQGVPLEKVLTDAKKLGYDYVNMDCNDASEELLQKLDDAGLQVWEIYDNFRWAEDPENMNGYRLIKAAKLMRSTHLLPVPGLYSGDPETEEEELDNMVEGLAAFVEEADKYGMVCGMEDYDHLKSPIRTIEGIQYFQERIPKLMTFFDTGNFFISCEDCWEAFRAFRKNTVSVHMKDRTLEKNGGMPKVRTDGSLMYPCAVGSGIMPLTRIVWELLGQGFDGVFGAEFFDSDNYTGDLAASAAFLQEFKNL